MCFECKVGTPSPHISFDVADVSYEAVSDDAREISLHDDGIEASLPIDDESDTEPEETYTLVPGGSTRGKDKLIDNLGYAYTVKKQYV